jgi:hypothetical protein
MKKIWLVGLGVLLATALSANASLSFVWSNAVLQSSSATQATWEDTADGGPVFFTATLMGSNDSFNFSFLNPPPPGGQERFTFNSSVGYNPITNTGSFLAFSASSTVPGSSVTNIAFGGQTHISGPGSGVVLFPSASTLNYGIINPGAAPDGSTVSLDIGTISLAVVPEVHQLAIALAATLIGATVLLRFRRSASI